MNWPHPIVLASTSPRRRSMLEDEGWKPLVRSPHVDDGLLASQGASAVAWSSAMAWLKARSVMTIQPPVEFTRYTILAADTVCDLDGRVIGQPSSKEEARGFLHGFRGRSHDVTTSVCLLEPSIGRRFIFSDSACVQMGDLSDDMIDAYLETDLWKGKAGGYQGLARAPFAASYRYNQLILLPSWYRTLDNSCRNTAFPACGVPFLRSRGKHSCLRARPQVEYLSSGHLSGYVQWAARYHLL